MVVKRSVGDSILMIFIYVIVGVIAFLCLYPMLHVLAASLSDPIRLLNHTGALFWPTGFSLEGYRIVLGNPNIASGYYNSIYYTVVGTLINMFFTTTTAYALSRKGFMFRRVITLGIIFTMYFSGGLIPNFLLVRNLGLFDTRWAMMLPGAIATWNLIVLRTCFQMVPASLEESAKIDGANDIIIFIRIFLPISKAPLSVIALFYAVGHWNAWFNAMIFLQDRRLFPLQTFLREILISNSPAGADFADGDAETFFLMQLVKYSL